jgi:uncharacterized protein YrrD
MLQLSASLLNRPVLSLRTSGPIAIATGLVINPTNLKIEGFYCQDRFDRSTKILLTQEIRDILPQGIAVNDYEALSDVEELVRLQDVINMHFELMGKPVVTVNKNRLGKVNDFAADSATLYIQKIYVTQSLLKSFSGGQLSIDRNQIIEITDKKIIIQEPLQPTRAGIPVTATPLA